MSSRGEDISAEVAVAFEDAMRGCRKTLTLRARTTCDTSAWNALKTPRSARLPTREKSLYRGCRLPQNTTDAHEGLPRCFAPTGQLAGFHPFFALVSIGTVLEARGCAGL